MNSLLLILTQVLILGNFFVNAGEVSSTQVAGLEFLYNNTNGNYWIWKNITEYGNIWNFTSNGSNSPNPCTDNWQGVTCTADCASLSVCNIIDLNMDSNNISGIIPNEIIYLSYIQSITISKQNLIGTIPSAISQLSNLHTIVLAENMLSELVPTSVGSLLLLTHFDLSENDLTGEFPSTLLTLTRLVALLLDKNDFSGTFPVEIGSLTLLETLNVGYNDFYGTIPTTIGLLTNLTTLYMDHSIYTGGFDQVIYSPKLQYMNLGDNDYMVGGFPPSLCDCLSLQHISIDHVLIGGTFPSCISAWSTLTYIHISDNQMSGTLPLELFQISTLRTARLNSMYLSGSLGVLFTNYSVSLTTLDLGDNIFSGSLPSFAFSPVLETFSASKNCFTASIPDAICIATSLLNLDLSGLTSGSSCLSATRVLGIGLTTVSTVPGSLPACIFNMPSIVQVNIAGNGLSSKLYEIPSSSNIRNLSLSYNRLTGTIPLSIQNRTMMRILDLSFNRLKGTVEQMNNYTLNGGTEANPETSVYLDSNRLSGSIPGQFSHSTAPLDILEGNIFSCVKNPLPDNDIYHNKYTCGSDDLDLPLYVFASVVTVVLMVSGAVWYTARQEQDNLLSTGKTTTTGTSVASNALHICDICWKYLWCTVDAREAIDIDPLLAHISLSFFRFRFIIIILALFTTIIVMPVFLILKLYDNGAYASITHQYGWIVSVAYMHKLAPAVVLNFLWGFTLLFLMAFEFWWYTNRESSLFLLERLLLFIGFHSGLFTIDKASSKHSKISGSVLTVMKKVLFIILNVSIVLVINALFVTAILTQSRAIQFLVVGLIIIFKLTWNPVVVYPRMAQLRFGSYMILLMVVFNNIIAPIVATMAVDVSCFESLFVTPDEITTTYYHVECVDSAFGVCTHTKTKSASTSFTPPWIYSDECSSAMLNYYLPIYVVMYGVVGIFVPVMQLVSLIVFSTPKEKNNDSNSDSDNTVTESRTTALLRHLKSTLYRVSSTIRTCTPIESEEDFNRRGYIVSELFLLGGSGKKRRSSSDDSVDRRSAYSQSSAVMGSENRISDTESDEDFHTSSFYNLKRLAVNNVMIFGLLLTFGISYPPLAIMLAANVVLNTVVFQACVYKHYQQAAAIPGCLKIWKNILGNEARDLYNVLFGSRTFLYVFSAMFAALFFFDISIGEDTLGALAFLILIYTGRLVAMYLRRAYPRLCLENNPLFLEAATNPNPDVKIHGNIIRVNSGYSNPDTSKSRTNSRDETVNPLNSNKTTTGTVSLEMRSMDS